MQFNRDKYRTFHLGRHDELFSCRMQKGNPAAKSGALFLIKEWMRDAKLL